MPKSRVHNEWFQPIAKTTCSCGSKKTQVFSWGQYVSGKWQTVKHFCQACFESEVLSELVDHAGPCGCSFQLNARTGHGPLPDWLKAAELQCNVKGKAA